MKALLEQSTILASADIKAKSLYGGIILALCYWLFWKAGLSRKLPPSPPSGLFHLFGHARIVFSRLPAQRYAALTKELGNIIYLSVFGRPIIVINSIEDARELLDKRGAAYSERPPTPLMSDLYGWKDMMNLLPCGERFRAQRRMMQQTFNSQNVKVYRESQNKRAVHLLNDLLHDDQSWHTTTRRFVSTNIMKATYGHEVKSDEDKFLKLAFNAVSALTSNPAGGTDLVDILPFMSYIPSWFPGGGLKKRAEEGRRLQQDLIELPYADLKSRMKSELGTSEHGMLPRLIEDYALSGENDPDRELDIKSVAAVTYAASLNTNGISTDTFLLMMVLHPEVARVAQEEIDRIVGPNRLPDLEDRAKLPVIDCIMKEVWRIHPPAPLVLPHATIFEDTYRGMHIPAKSIIVPNIWQMMRDPKYFNSPEIFLPERFLEKVKRYESSEQALNGLYLDDPSSIVFGFGRRICPGRFFADEMFWLVVACTLAVFDFHTHIDPDTGIEVIPQLKCLPGQLSALEPFKYRLSPRSEAHARLVVELTADAEA